jgi:hypothetical protein
LGGDRPPNNIIFMNIFNSIAETIKNFNPTRPITSLAKPVVSGAIRSLPGIFKEIDSVLTKKTIGMSGNALSSAQQQRASEVIKKQVGFQEKDNLRNTSPDFYSTGVKEKDITSKIKLANNLMLLESKGLKLSQEQQDAIKEGRKAETERVANAVMGMVTPEKQVVQNTIEKVSRNLVGEDRKLLTEFIDAVRLKKPTVRQEIEARKTLEAMGISGEKTNKQIADTFDDILSREKQTDKTVKTFNAPSDLSSSISKAKASGQSFDENVYHLTKSKFKEFNPNEEGIFFTDEQGKNNIIAKWGDRNVIERNVKLDNPFVVSKENISKLLEDKDFFSTIKSEYILENKNDIIETFTKKYNQSYPRERSILKKQLEKLGYDGIIIPQDKFLTGDFDVKSIVAFKPKQIKTRSQLKAELDKIK